MDINFTSPPKSHDYKFHCSVHSFLFTSFPFAQARGALEARLVSKKVTAWKGAGKMGMGGRFYTNHCSLSTQTSSCCFFFHRNAAMKGLSSNPETKIVMMFSGSAQKPTTTFKGFCIQSRFSSQIGKG